MSAADHGGRGGTAASRTSSTLHEANRPNASMSGSEATSQTSTNVPFRQAQALSSTSIPLSSTALHNNKLDPPVPEAIARNELLRDAVFPDWKNDAGKTELESPDEMQKKDPLATQIWKLYSKTKTRLPNQERMENLTWRMMAMSLRRRNQMKAAYASVLLLLAFYDTDVGVVLWQAIFQRPVVLLSCACLLTQQITLLQIP